jgi:allophanate hydrolase subunit 2
VNLQVVSSGITLIQDGGRKGYLESGVGHSGAWDDLQYKVLGKLLNQTNPAVFEVISGKFEIEVTETATYAIVGNSSVSITGKPVSTGVVQELKPGQRLTISSPQSGVTYLGISDLQLNKILGSAATDTSSGLGPKQVVAGDSFDFGQARRELIGSFIQSSYKSNNNDVHFITTNNELTSTKDLTVTGVSRSGIRLACNLDTETATSIPSIPVFPGVIQRTPSGELIILGVDCGVTGGYPVVGVVVSADLHKLSRLTVGENINLISVNTDKASELKRIQDRYLDTAVVNPANFGAW